MADQTIFDGSGNQYPFGSFYADLANRIAALEAILGTAPGTVPDGSITEFKLADASVSTVKLKDGAITQAKAAQAFLDYIFARAKWRSVKVGEWYFANTALAGVDIPPVSDPDFVFIELTAGLTGAGQFNQGKLRGETVTGSAPLIDAFATVDVSTSPMYNVNVRLLNTEGRILRPSTTPGTVQNDAMQRITGSFDSRNDYPNAPSGAFDTFDIGGGNRSEGASPTRRVSFDSAKVARTDTETRMKNIGVKAYMRIK